MERGIVRIKPVLVGIPHYREVYASVCSPDIDPKKAKGTPEAVCSHLPQTPG